jgi:lipoyl-dependent peroxiredoxin
MIVVGSSKWRGTFREGEGTISTATTTLDAVPYTFASRFEGAPGAIPEELFAAAHAGCFNHALANGANLQGLTVETISTSAEVAMGADDQGPAILGVHFTVEATAPTLTEEKFQQLAERARAFCAISKAVSVEITMKATLVG